jgi:hypothetical protein
MKLRFQTFLKRVNAIRQKWVKFVALALAVFITTLSLVVFNPNPAVATKKVVLTYGPQTLPIPVSELVTFARTGEASRVLRFLTGVADVDRDAFRTLLTREIPANVRFLDRALNFIGGELFLYEIGQVIYPPSRRKEIEALRSSIVLSAADDRSVSLLEVIEKYPAQELYIDARQINKAYGEVEFLVEGAMESIMFLRETLADLIC